MAAHSGVHVRGYGFEYKDVLQCLLYIPPSIKTENVTLMLAVCSEYTIYHFNIKIITGNLKGEILIRFLTGWITVFVQEMQFIRCISSVATATL